MILVGPKSRQRDISSPEGNDLPQESHRIQEPSLLPSSAVKSSSNTAQSLLMSATSSYCAISPYRAVNRGRDVGGCRRVCTLNLVVFFPHRYPSVSLFTNTLCDLWHLSYPKDVRSARGGPRQLCLGPATRRGSGKHAEGPGECRLPPRSPGLVDKE